MTADLFITGARIVDPANDRDEVAAVHIAGGVIKAIGADFKPTAQARTINAEGRLLAPGLIDLHTHLREPGGDASETIVTGCDAAARGGFTHIFCMPNTNPVCDSPRAVRYTLDRAAEGCGVNVHPVGAVTSGMSGEQLTDFDALLNAGAGALSDDGLPVADAGVMRLALLCARELDAVIFDHCEDMSLTGAGVMHDGPHAARLGLPGIPRSSEASIILRDGLLAHETRGRLHVCHVSTADSVSAIRWLKSIGAPVTAEVSPHHLTLIDARVGPFDTHAKMKPPLCEERDRQALIEALEDGTLDCIATDHAPHAPELKARTFAQAPFGIIGMETAFAVCHDAFVRTGRWSLSFLVDKLAAAPARVMNRADAWGRLDVGGPADLALFDLETEHRLEPKDLGSKSRNCPWLGETFSSRCVLTLAGGRVAWSADEAGG